MIRVLRFFHFAPVRVERAMPLHVIGHDEGRFEIITTINSFHGRTLAGIEATGQEAAVPGGALELTVRHDDLAAGDGDGDLALHGAEEMLRGPRLISPPFLRRNEAHARAEAFVVARGLAGILERRVVAGPVSARTHLSCKLRRISRWAAAYAGRWFCVL